MSVSEISFSWIETPFNFSRELKWYVKNAWGGGGGHTETPKLVL